MSIWGIDIALNTPGVMDLRLDCEAGTWIGPFEDCEARLGFVVATGASPFAARRFTPMYLRPFDATCRPTPPDRSIEILDRHLEMAERYAKHLSGGPWRCLTTWQDSGVCWRFTLVTEPSIDAHRLSESVRQDGFHVSNLFWPLHQLFGVDEQLPGAEEFGPLVINLWVSDVDIAYVDACCASLSRRVESGAFASADPSPISVAP